MKKTNGSLNKIKSKKKLIGIIGIGIALVIAGTAFTVHSKTAEIDEETKTKTSEATTMTIENTLSSEGEVEGSIEEKVVPHAGYYLEEVKVEAGDSLKEGDTILTYTNGDSMTAPYNCVVKNWSLPDEEAQMTTDHYVTISGTDVLQMELTVDESDVYLVEEGDDATVTIEATKSSCEGVVTSVSEVGDYSDSGSTFTAIVTFDNDGKIKMGMTGTADILLEQAKNVIGIPVNAVSTKGNESYVTIQKSDGTEEEITVTTGIKNDAYIEIREGLSEGDTVVVPVTEDDSSRNGFDGMPDGGMPDGGKGGPGGEGGHEGGGQPPGNN